MDYATARPQITDGDIICVKDGRGLFHQLIRHGTGGEYTHAGIAVWIDGGLFLANVTFVGNCLMPLRHWADTQFDVFRCPPTVKDLRQYVLRDVRIDYDFADLALMWLYMHGGKYLGMKLTENRKALVCSSYVSQDLADCGDPYAVLEVATPTALAFSLQQRGFFKFQVN